ncbi:MAG: nucleoside triphosphate pyrophosphohydrolase [candidate division Zixibacteria bacterium]|nr:nucleoside triphosphate pyrophosphohydrolase [candidate division Zixibacteria bacterium]
MAILRSEEGCAWDRKQTHQSLLPYLIEETYEVQETIEAEDWPGLKEELGDLMCQIVFHSQLAAERNVFDIDDAVNLIADKLVARHPHVFGEKKDLSPDQVRDQWEQIKVESGEKKSVLSGLPRSMPSLTMAYRMGEKAAGIGFDWNNASQVVAKLDEELAEVKAEIESGDREALTDEIGDLLFAVASLARKCEINPELALKKALDKFKNRFDLLEEQIKSSSKKFSDYTLDELENIWQQIKL